ncbi:MAG: peptidylprolyl isomerase [Pseudomonadota bacterium]
MRFFVVLFAMLAGLGVLPAQAQSTDTILAPTAAPSPTDKENLWILDLSTGGRVTILLRPDMAPHMVERIKILTRRHFYDGTIFHRVIEGFMAQGGDPKGDGTGGSDLPDVPAEFSHLPHVRGAVAAAREGAPAEADEATKKKAENSANSQFFIMFTPRFGLDRNYTVFGRVISGMEYVDAIPRGEPPAQPARIVHAWIGSDNPPPYEAPKTELPPGETAVTLPGTAPKQ